jgi:hypothetical protein
MPLLKESLEATWQGSNLPLALHVLVYTAELRGAQQRPMEAAPLLDVALRYPATSAEDRRLSGELSE